MTVDFAKIYQDLNNLNVEDFKKIGTAPAPVRILLIALLCGAVIGAGIWLMVLPRIDALKVVEGKEQELRQEFTTVYNKSANLEAYKAQLDDMRRSFGAMLRQLPDTTDIESLLVDLSQTSVASGLEVEYFKPGQEVPQEFYAEYPIELSVSGTYHEFGTFVSGLAALPRIVTLQDISIEPSGQKSSNRLKMDLKAVTYRYLQEEQ